MSTSETDNIIGSVDLNRTSKLIFSIRSWQGRLTASVRKFVSSARYDGPTKSGLVLAGDLLIALIEALHRLQRDVPGIEVREFARVSKSNQQEIVIGLVPADTLGTLPSVDIREFVNTPEYSGFTKKGIRFSWDKLTEVIALFEIQVRQLGEETKNEPTLFPDALPPWVEKADNSVNPSSPRHDSIVNDVLPDGPKDFPGHFIANDEKCQCTQVELPAESIELFHQRDGKYVVRSSRGFCHVVRNPSEASFIIYSHLRGNRSVQVPSEMIAIFRAVKGYENYLRDLGHSLLQAYERKSSHRVMAEHQAKEAFRKMGLPWIDRS